MAELDGDADVEANGDELDVTGAHEEDAPYSGFQRSDGLPGDPEDAEDDHDTEE